MALFGRRKTSIGLDVGSGFVKLVEVDHSGAGPEVTKIAMRPLLPDAIVEGEIMDHVLVADTISGLFTEAGMKGRDVITAVGGHDVIIKKIEMDRMKESDAREVIRWEAEQHVPFDIKNVKLDFQILDPTGSGVQMEVLYLAVDSDQDLGPLRSGRHRHPRDSAIGRSTWRWIRPAGSSTRPRRPSSVTSARSGRRTFRTTREDRQRCAPR